MSFTRRKFVLGMGTVIFFTGSASSLLANTRQEKEVRYAMIHDESRCNGCNICARACRKTNHVPAQGSRLSIAHIPVIDNDNGTQYHFFRQSCQHCEDAPCIDVCPTGASWRDEQGIVRVEDYQQIGPQGHFTLLRQDKEPMRVTLNAPGRHNALNAAAAVAVATEEGIDDEAILRALESFQGTGRRFDFLGEFPLEPVNGKSGTAMLVDDYGHHPTEVDATIKAARAGWPDKNLVMLFQPHRFTRTRDLYDDFANVLTQVDTLLMLEVYPAGEAPIPGADSRSLCRTIRGRGKIDPILVPDPAQVAEMLAPVLTGNDLILVQGAGNIGKIARSLAEIKLKPQTPEEEQHD